jgi:hypothetical protein
MSGPDDRDDDTRDPGQRLRDDALDRVERGAGDVWNAAALRAVRQIATQKEYFQAEEVWKLVAPPENDNRALGAVMQRAKKAGICEPTDRLPRSHRPSKHASPTRLWKSLVYRGPS